MTKSTGRQKEREERARANIERCFDAIIRLVEAGVPMNQARLQVPEKPTQNSLRHYMRQHPAQWERFKAARIAAFGCVVGGKAGQFSPEAWNAALHTIATEPGTHRENKRQGQPTYNECWRKARTDPDFKARLLAAIDARNERPGMKPTRYSAKKYEQAIKYIRENQDRKLSDVDLNLKRINLPSLAAVYAKRRLNGNIAEAYAEISSARGVRRYSDEQHSRALEILKSDPVNARKILRQNAGKLPSMNAICGRGKTYAVTAEVFEEARLVRREAYQEIWAAARLARKAKRREPRVRRVYETDVLKTGLLLNEAYRAANALFHRGIPDRDDMISEVVLAVESGDISLDQIGERGKAIGWRFLNKQSDRRFDSLDEPVFEDGDLAFVDTFTSDQWSFEGAI